MQQPNVRRNPKRGLEAQAEADREEEEIRQRTMMREHCSAALSLSRLGDPPVIFGAGPNLGWSPSVTCHTEVVAQDVLLLVEMTYREWQQSLNTPHPPRNLYNDAGVFATYAAFVRTVLCVGDKERHWDCAAETHFTGYLLHHGHSTSFPGGSPMKLVCVKVEKLLLGTATPAECQLKHYVSPSATRMARAASHDLCHCLPCAGWNGQSCLSHDLCHCLPCAGCARRRQVHWDGLLQRQSACPQAEERRACALSRSAG